MILVIVVPLFWSVHGECTDIRSVHSHVATKEGYNYYVSRSIARFRVAKEDFIHDIEKTIFSKSWRSLSIHSDGFLAARTSRTNERQETCQTNELRIIHRTNEETPRSNKFQSIHRTNEETRRTNEFQSVYRTEKEICRTN